MVASLNQETGVNPKSNWVRWLTLGGVVLAIFVVVFLFLAPKPLVVKGTLKTSEGPVNAGVYDFRLKFYDVTTRTDLVYSYDAIGIQVDENGGFDVELPGDALTVATLMQVCVSSSNNTDFRKEQVTIPSCEDPTKTDEVIYDQTVCGLTTVDQDPANPITWLAAKNTIYTMPTRACGGTDGEVASVSSRDVVTPLLEEPGTLGELLSGVDLQPGTVLAIGSNGELEAITPQALGEEIAKDQAESEAEEGEPDTAPTSPQSSTTIIQGDTDTDQQTLSLAGNVLSISGGNSITLPDNDSGDGDKTIGNELTNVSGSGLVRVGAGTALDPYKVQLQTCMSGEILKSDGTSWDCTPDTGGSSYLAGSGLQLSGTTFSVNSPTCSGTTKLQWNGSAFICSPDQDTTYAAGTGLSLAGTTFNNTGVLNISGSGPITSTGGQNSTISFMNGTSAGQVWQWNGTAWALATLSADGDGVIGNEVVNVTGSSSGLTRSGSGTVGDPYTLAANTGNGLQVVSNQITINSPTCSGTDKLQWNGTAFVCATDQNTTYSAVTNGGLQLVGTQFGLVACANGQLLKATATSGEYACAADNDTTYSAGSGLSLAGTTFSNTGVLSVAGSGPITSTGGQNPTVSFANGSSAGQFWQWDGSAWVLASLPADSDSVIGNEVTGVTGGNSGLARSGSGTSVDPYTLAVSVGNGLQLAGGNVAVNSPTCSGTDKLQWSGTAFVCAADVNTTYSAGSGLSLAGTTFNNTGVLSVTASGALTSSGGQNPNIAFADGANAGEFWQWNGSAWVLASLPADGDGVVGNEVTNVTGSNSGLTRSGSGTAVDPYTLAVSVGNGLQLVGGNVAISSPTCSGTDKLQWSGSAFACSADVNTTYSAGTGLSLVGTTFNNTGVLSVTASGALTSSGGQNPDIAFANGSVTGQFWQWNGTAWALATLPADGDTVIGNEVTNVTGSNSGLTRSGSGTAVDPYTLAVSVGNGLQLVGGNVAVNSPTCSGTTKLQWNGTAFICSADVDTTDFSITDGSTSQSVAATQAITFVGDANSKTTVTLGGTRQLTFGLDTTGASSGQVLTYTGAALAWQTPTTYAPTSCAIGGTYFCQGGNTFGTSAVLGTNDAQSLTFETNNAVQMTILANGNVGIGTSPTEKLDVNGNINIPATSSTVGVIKQGGIRLIHTKDDGSNSSFFAGLNSGNLTTTGFDNVGIGSNALTALTDGFYNTAVGSGALTANTSGTYNTAVGFGSMEANTEGYYNSAFGERALITNVDGFNNTAVGSDSLFDNLSGSDNTGLGVGALGSNTTGTGNTGVGSYAGSPSGFDNENITGSNNTFIGKDTGLGSATQRNNSTTIGAFSVVDQSDSLILGCINGVNGCTARTRIGVGTATPQNMLHVDGGAGAVSTMMQFTNATTGQTTSDGFNLGIDSNGTVFFQQRETGAMAWYTSGSTGLRMLLDSVGRLGISQNSPGYLLHVGSSTTTAGTAVARFESASGTCTVTPISGMACTSDERAKKNISDYNGALDIVNQVEVKQYNIKTDPDGAEKQIGVIAQQVEGLLPSLVTTDGDGKKAFSYAGLTPVLLQAIKEQQAQLADIQKGVWTGGVVTKDATFKTTATFEGPVKFSQSATFEGDVTILGKIKLSGDQVNSAIIREGQRRVKVFFKGNYSSVPYITATPREFVKGAYRITEVKKTGFTIELSQTQSSDVRFDWHAFSR